jgi:putative flippase GtrA
MMTLDHDQEVMATSRKHRSPCTFSLSRAVIGQAIRYGIVGLVTNAIGYMIYLGVTYATVPPKIAVTILYSLGAMLSFFLNRTWTFGHRGTLTRSGLRFALAHLGGYGLNLVIIIGFHDMLGLPHQAVQAMAIIIVAGYLFVAFRLFVFAKERPS